MERETGIEPATNSLEGCDSTTELLPPSRSRASTSRSAGTPASRSRVPSPRRPGRSRAHAVDRLQHDPARVTNVPPNRRLTLGWRAEPPPRCRRFGRRAEGASIPRRPANRPLRIGLPTVAKRAKVGGEGRTRTFEATRATDLQSAAFDRSATSPVVCVGFDVVLACGPDSCFPTGLVLGRLFSSPAVFRAGCLSWPAVFSSRLFVAGSFWPACCRIMSLCEPGVSQPRSSQHPPRRPGVARWSWRRDLNPRPADYKSAALPT